MRCRRRLVYNPAMRRDGENLPPKTSTWPLWQRMLLLCLGYFFCAWLGRVISPAGGVAVSYWLPGGLFVAALLANPTRDWPWLMASILPANIGFDLIHDPEPNWRLIAGFCIANILQAGAGAALVRKFVAASPRLASLKEFFGLLFFAGVVGSALGATVSATVLVQLGWAASWASTWKILWGGNVMAVLVLSPLVLVFGEAALRRAVMTGWTMLRTLEVLAIFGGTVAFLWFVLVEGRGINSPKIPVLVFMIWAGLRFGLPGAGAAVFLLAITVSFLTTKFLLGLSAAEIAAGSYVFTLQTFVAITALVTFVPTIVLAQRNRALASLRESQARFQQLNDAAFEGIVISEGDRVLDVNDQCVRMLGWTRPEMLGRPLLDFIAPESQAAGAAAIAVKREVAIEHRLLRRDGSAFDAEVQARVVQADGRVVGMTAIRDITARKFEENLNRTQANILEMISSGQPWGETLDALLRQIEAQSPEMHTSILLLDADGVHLRHGAAPSLPPEYVAAINGVAIGADVGSCGTAAFRREAVVVSDIASDPLWAAFKQLVLPHGLLACWSTPIFDAQKNVLGTFAIYYRQARAPEPGHLRLIQMATHTAAICLLKHRAEKENWQFAEREQQARIQYTFQLIAAQEAERKRIAAEIHDSLGQNLLLIKNLAAISLRDQEPTPTYERVASISHLAAQCIAEARQISHALHPPQLDHLGLTRALEAMIENMAQASDIRFTRKFDAVDEFFPTEAAMNFYRIVQESLNNILKHSRAKNVDIRLERDIHEVQLCIADDGCGFPMDKPDNGGKGLGLKNISERVRMLGGKLKMNSTPGKGTRVEVTVPISEKFEA